MRSKELSVGLRDRIVSRHRSGEGYQKRPDGLPGHILRACAHQLASVFPDIFNLSYFKQITIVHMAKNPKVTCLNYYRRSTLKGWSALKVPKNTVASIILKWNMFATTNTLPRAGCPSNRGRRVLVREVTKNLINLTPIQRSLWRWLSFWKVHPSLQHSTN